MHKNKLAQAVQFAIDHETTWSREIGDAWGIHHQDPPPWNRLLGPVHARGPVSGTILLEGRPLISWGEPQRADLTFSIAKTYLALLAGIAHDRGLLPDVDEPIGKRLSGIGFDHGSNAEVTWKHLLQQTSEWEGECFGVPDQVDRYRSVQFQEVTPAGKKGDERPLQAPGTYWEYNDVRVNQLSLALLHLFRQPLPEVFRESIMQPIGASDDWRWVGYDNAWIELDGRRVQSVPGGTHWGAGVSISARDQARVGQLMLDAGAHQGRQLIPREWVRRMQVPNAVAPFYGLLTWLNRDGRMFTDASRASWFMFGAGGNAVWIDPDNEMVVVWRWLDGAHSEEFVSRVARALT